MALPINKNLELEFNQDNLEVVYLAGGCFWGVDAFIRRVIGVYQTEVGYANGTTENPSYEEVCKKNTGHAETVKITFDNTKISLEEVIDSFFGIIDPTSYNKQGGDVGSQYRTGIYYIDDKQKFIAEQKIMEYTPKYDKPILVEVVKLENYYPAEEYHQDYLEKNPNGYCHITIQ